MLTSAIAKARMLDLNIWKSPFAYRMMPPDSFRRPAEMSPAGLWNYSLWKAIASKL